MEALFNQVLQASLQGGILIGVVIALRLILRGAPKKYVCLLWLMAVVRLLVPLDISSTLSLQPTVPSPARLTQALPDNPSQGFVSTTPDSDSQPLSEADVWLEEQPSLSFPAETSAQTGQIPTQSVESSAVAPMQRTPLTAMEIAGCIWAVAAAGFALYSFAAYVLLRLRLREAIRLSPGIWESSQIPTPFILGYLRPRIYLPTRLSPGNRRYILAHEQAHLKQGDHWFKLLGYIALVVHWFNPLVWCAYLLLCRDMEMACDERVVKGMDLEERKHYSAALLACSARRPHLTAFPVAFGEVSVKQRILRVLKYRKPGLWISLTAIAALIFVGPCFLTNPPEQTSPAEETTTITETRSPDSGEYSYDLSDFRPLEKSTDPSGFGISLEIYFSSPTHATICLSADDQERAADCLTNEAYWIEVQTESGWEPLPERQAPVWFDTVYNLSWDGLREQTLDWSELYGPLYGGPYRLCKAVTVQGQEYTYSAEFFIYENDPEAEAEELALRERIATVVMDLLMSRSYHILQVVTDEAGETVSRLEAMQNDSDFLAVSLSSDALLSGMCYDGNYYVRYGDSWVAAEQANITLWPFDFGFTYAYETMRVSLSDSLPAATAREFSCQIDYAGNRQYVTFLLNENNELAQIRFDHFFYTGNTADTLTRQSGVLDVLGTDAQAIESTISDAAAQTDYLPLEGLEQLTEQRSREDQYDLDFTLGSDSFLWRVSDWYFRTSGENVTPTGMQVIFADAGANTPGGTLSTQGGYWLEHLVDDQWISVPALADRAVDSRPLFTNPDAMSPVTLNYDWTDTYGALDPGFYRLAQTVVLDRDGDQQEKTVYAKFRIYADNTTQLVNQCRDALTSLLSQESYHLLATNRLSDQMDSNGDGTADHGAYYYTTEVWKSRDDYLEDIRYIFYEDGSLRDQIGMMLHNGTTYQVEWSGDTPSSVTQDGYVEPDSFQLWANAVEICDALLYDITQEGDSIRVLEHFGNLSANKFEENIYTFRDDGALESIVVSTINPDGSRVIEQKVEIYDTEKGEIDRILNGITAMIPQ